MLTIERQESDPIFAAVQPGFAKNAEKQPKDAYHAAIVPGAADGLVGNLPRSRSVAHNMACELGG
jgi:hypothetical protein